MRSGAKMKAFKMAVPLTLPIGVSFFFLAVSYGVLMGTKDFSKDVHLTSSSWGAPETLAIAAVILLHVWCKNMLLSIVGGTAVYMLLVQFVF